MQDLTIAIAYSLNLHIGSLMGHHTSKPTELTENAIFRFFQSFAPKTN